MANLTDSTDSTHSAGAPAEASRRQQLLEVLNQGQRRRTVTRWVALVVLLVAAGVGGFLWQRRSTEPPMIHYRSVPVSRGTLHESVTATGTLQPVGAVELGAEVTGKLVKVNVDVNDVVEAGQVLAEIDPEQLQARLAEARASLLSARASEQSAKASLAEAKLTAERRQALFERGLASSQELESAQAAAARAEANVATAKAQITVANAGVASAKTALGKAQIVAPSAGVVLARNVEQGQTLTAGFQTPVLFTLGHDLKQLELEVEVDEADIGKVSEGQTASFSVDAYPNRNFDAKVVKLHNLPTTSEGSANTVVTYSAVLTVDNTERLLRPGMTATAIITTRTLNDVLLVPNVALRFEPPKGGMGGRGFIPFFGGRGGGPRPAQSEQPEPDPNQDRVWLQAGPKPRPVAVQVLGSDGVQSAVEPLKGATLEPEAQVVTDVVTEPAP